MQVFNPSRAAAMASMRPNWPPPTIPIVPPGGTGLCKVFIWATSFWSLGDRFRLLGAPGVQPLFHARIRQSQNRRGMQRRILGAGFPNRKSRHRHPAGHLGDGEQRIQTLQGAAFHRHAQYRQAGHAGHHARQMRGAAGACDDRPQASRRGPFGIVRHAVGGAMGRDDAGLIAYPQRIQHMGRGLHGRPIGLAAHDDADGWLTFASIRHTARLPTKRRSIGSKKPKESAVLTLVNHSSGTIDPFLNAARPAFPGQNGESAMKVERSSSARSVARAAYARRIEAAGGTDGLDAVMPAASVLGIPEAEFTPKVRDAIMGLMSEVDSLRRELTQTRARLEDA